MGQGADRQAAGHLATGRAPHAVGYDPGVAIFPKVLQHISSRKVTKQGLLIPTKPSDQKVILIDGTHLSRVRQPAELYFDGRREKLEFLVFDSLWNSMHLFRVCLFSHGSLLIDKRACSPGTTGVERPGF